MWYLVIVVFAGSLGGGIAMDKIPMRDREMCLRAADTIDNLRNRGTMTACVEGTRIK